MSVADRIRARLDALAAEETVSTATKYTLRLCIESKTGHSWTPLTATRTGILAAAAWRDDLKTWCARNPLPDGYEYWIPLPRAHR